LGRFSFGKVLVTWAGGVVAYDLSLGDPDMSLDMRIVAVSDERCSDEIDSLSVDVCYPLN